MYRLLVVTQEPRALELFAAMEGWEATGFKPPRVRQTVDEAVETLKKHRIDAVAIADDMVFAPLKTYLDKGERMIPIFDIVDTKEEQWSVVRDVYQLLNQLRADYSNDDHDEAYRFQLARDRWMKKLLCGMMPTAKGILLHHKMLRCSEAVDTPRLYVRLNIPQGAHFMEERWHYGSDRLEVALRNFFGVDQDAIQFHLAVQSPEEVRVMISPKADCKKPITLTAEQALGYVEDILGEIENYLGLSIKILEIKKMDGLTAFAAGESENNR